MKRHHERLERRARYADHAKGCCSLVRGDETVDELRHIVTVVINKCPLERRHPHCPFRMLSGLGYHSMRNLVGTLSKEQCMALFEAELKLRAEALGRGHDACDPAPK
jgi:hypothetical protein